MEGLVGDLEGDDEIAAVLSKPLPQPTKDGLVRWGTSESSIDLYRVGEASATC